MNKLKSKSKKFLNSKYVNLNTLILFLYVFLIRKIFFPINFQQDDVTEMKVINYTELMCGINLGGNHPLFTSFIWFISRIVPSNTEYVISFFNIIVTLFSLALFYKLIKTHSSERIAFISTLSLLASSNFLVYSISLKQYPIEVLGSIFFLGFFYETIKKDSLTFSSEDNNNSYNGIVDFKPFYFSANFNYEGLSAKYLFEENSILSNLINSEILNNKNFSAILNLKVKNITNINEFNNLLLKISIEEGNIKFSNSTIMWKDDVKISLDDSLLTLDEEGINLLGTILLEFIDIDNFYSSYQIVKKNRKKIDKIKIDFVYNLDNKEVSFFNSKINNLQNDKIEEFLDIFNSKTNRVFNKITFKNFVNKFFEIYAG